MKSAIFWDVKSYSFAEVYRRLEGTLLNFYQTAWRQTPQDSSPHSHHCESLIPNIFHHSPDIGYSCQEQTAAKLTRRPCIQPTTTDPGIENVFSATGRTWREIKSEIDFPITETSKDYLQIVRENQSILTEDSRPGRRHTTAKLLACVQLTACAQSSQHQIRLQHYSGSPEIRQIARCAGSYMNSKSIWAR